MLPTLRYLIKYFPDQSIQKNILYNFEKEEEALVCSQGAEMTADLAKAFEHETPGYLNSVSRVLIKNVAKGMSFPDASPPDDQAHSLVKVPLVVARYAGVLFTLCRCVV